jgi:hypothetical protein
MAQGGSRHVVPNPKGGWDIKKPGTSQAIVHTDTKDEAIARARQIVKNQGGGEVRIHGKDGRIQDSDTIAPGNDPYPPRNKR